MSRRLTKHIRTQIIKAVMEDTFKARFEAVEKKLAAALLAVYEQEHPDFFELLKQPGGTEYLRINDSSWVYCHKPKEGYVTTRFTSLRLPGWLVDRDTGALTDFWPRLYANLPQRDVTLPLDSPEVAEAEELSRAAEEAYDTLKVLVYGFNTVEAFIKEAPQFERFVPNNIVQKKLPALPVQGLLEQLAKAGVPKGRDHD